MPQWEPIDPQLHRWVVEGVNPGEMCLRLGWDKKKRQTIVDRLRKLGLKEPAKPKATEEISTPGGPVEVQPGRMSIEDANTAHPEPVSPIGDIAHVQEITGPLSPAEAKSLEQYEQVIAQGIKTFVEVGQALYAIREQRLYRQDYGTFEDYLRRRWDLSRPHAYRMIDAAKVMENLSPIGDIIPINEAQARPLAALPPERQAEAWREAVQTAPAGKVTAKHVQSAVKRVQALTPNQAQRAEDWRRRFSRHFRDFEQLIERFKRSGGVLVLVRDWEVPWQREFLQTLRDHAKTLQDIVAHFEKVITGEEAALRALEHPPEQ
jgi:hypothetical protein